MDFLKRHMFFIVCGVAGAAGIVLAVTGIGAMPRVEAELEKAKRVYADLGSLQRSPVNQAHIAREERRIEQTMEDRDAVFAEARRQYDYEPLVPGVFPNGDDDALRRFRRVYAAAIDRLFESLEAGQPADDNDIDIMRDRIADEELQAVERGLDRGAAQPERIPEGPTHSPAGILTKAGAKKDAIARANMAKAQNIFCYAVNHREARPPLRVSSLDFHPGMVDTGTVDAPYPMDAWQAQVGYWIQKDVVDAIVAVNNEAASAARAQGEDLWVGIMPVKEVISVRVTRDYVLPEAGEFAGAAPEGYSEALPPATGDTVFTGSVSSQAFEIVQFTVKLVMDQRDIPRLIRALSTDSFHTLLRVAYQVVPPNRTMRGKIYGSEPTVIVVMDFESAMLGEVFRPLMPREVCETLEDAGYGAKCPEPVEEEEEYDEEG